METRSHLPVPCRAFSPQVSAFLVKHAGQVEETETWCCTCLLLQPLAMPEEVQVRPTELTSTPEFLAWVQMALNGCENHLLH